MSDDQTPEQSETSETSQETPAAEIRSGKKSKAERRRAAAAAQAGEEAPVSISASSEAAEPTEPPAARAPTDRSAAAGAAAGAAQNLFEQGVQALLRGEYDTAEIHYGQALALHRKAGDRVGQIAALEQLGHLCFLRGAETQARDYYQQAGALRAN